MEAAHLKVDPLSLVSDEVIIAKLLDLGQRLDLMPGSLRPKATEIRDNLVFEARHDDGTQGCDLPVSVILGVNQDDAERVGELLVECAGEGAAGGSCADDDNVLPG